MSAGGCELWRWRFQRTVLGLLMGCLSPLLLMYICWRLCVQRRSMPGLKHKFFGNRNASARTGQIMIHGVSMGEVMLMKPVVPLIEKATGKKCFLTSSTSTGMLSLEKNFSQKDLAYFPFDLPWAVNTFLSHHKPSMVVLLELELWPLFLCSCFARNIPVLLLNARVGESSFRNYRRLSFLLAPMFAHIQCAVAQNAVWGARLKQLGFSNVHIGASLKADIVHCADEEKIHAERQRLSLNNNPIFLIASSSDSEEELLIKSWLRWGHHTEQEHNWQLIICPRHPERGPAIQKLCEKLSLHAQRTSSPDTIVTNVSGTVIIVDEIGRLGALYALADIAAVGGSFGSGRHGQNMLESAAARTCTVVGWDTSNQPDAMALLRAHNAIIECRPDDIDHQLQTLATNPDRRQQLAQAGHQAWASSRGAAERSVNLLFKPQKSDSTTPKTKK